MRQILFHLNKNWNINTLVLPPNKKFRENWYSGLSFYMQTHTHTDKQA